MSIQMGQHHKTVEPRMAAGANTVAAVVAAALPNMAGTLHMVDCIAGSCPVAPLAQHRRNRQVAVVAVVPAYIRQSPPEVLLVASD